MTNAGAYYFFLLTGIIICSQTIFGQDYSVSKIDRLYYVQSDFIAGKNVANYSSFPNTRIRKGLSFYFGTARYDTIGKWQSFYKHPQSGLYISYTNLGCDSVLGTEISVMPYVAFRTFNSITKNIYIKFGLGASYFNKMYNEVTNRPNKAIGSSFTWACQAFIYKSFYISPYLNLNFGAGYLHASNGHIQLPNFGLNAAAVDISCQFFINKRNYQHELFFNTTNLHDKDIFLIFRKGTGIHVLGGTEGPIGGKKRFVHSFTLGGSILFNQVILIRSGFTYRYYEQFRLYALEKNPPNYSGNAFLYASNLYYFLGCELLLGHFGLDAEGGINLFKPFYKDFFDAYEVGNKTWYILKSIFPVRLGLNLYIVNTDKNPRYNICIGAHIDANFGEADFSELSITILKRCSK